MKTNSIDDYLPQQPFNFAGINMFERARAKEIWFIGKNKIVCQNCGKETRMSRVICDACGVNMNIPKEMFESILREMISKK